MKRVLACLLSLALMALPCVQAYGAGAGLESSRETAESSAPETKGTESVPPETDETEETETESASPEKPVHARRSSRPRRSTWTG